LTKLKGMKPSASEKKFFYLDGKVNGRTHFLVTFYCSKLNDIYVVNLLHRRKKRVRDRKWRPSADQGAAGQGSGGGSSSQGLKKVVLKKWIKKSDKDSSVCPAQARPAQLLQQQPPPPAEAKRTVVVAVIVGAALGGLQSR